MAAIQYLGYNCFREHNTSIRAYLKVNLGFHRRYEKSADSHGQSRDMSMITQPWKRASVAVRGFQSQ